MEQECKADGAILHMGKRVETGIHLFEKIGNASILGGVNNFHACLFIVSFESQAALSISAPLSSFVHGMRARCDQGG